MVLQHSSVGKSLLWHISYNNYFVFNAKIGTFPLSYAVIPSFISCFTTFYCIDPYINNFITIILCTEVSSKQLLQMRGVRKTKLSREIVVQWHHTQLMM